MNSKFLEVKGEYNEILQEINALKEQEQSQNQAIAEKAKQLNELVQTFSDLVAQNINNGVLDRRRGQKTD